MTTECWTRTTFQRADGTEERERNKRRWPGDRIRWAPDNWMIEPVCEEATVQSSNSGSLTHSHRIVSLQSDPPFIAAIRFLIDFYRLSLFFSSVSLFPLALHSAFFLSASVFPFDVLPARLCRIKWPMRGATSRPNKHAGAFTYEKKKWNENYFNSPLSDLLLGNCK